MSFHGPVFGIHSRLTRRQQQVLKKFQIGYTAWSVTGVGSAFLMPGKNVIGRQERVYIQTLDELECAGFIVCQEEHLHDRYWSLAPKRAS